MGLTWAFNSDAKGYKVLKASVSGGVAGTANITKFNGSIINPVASSTSFTTGDQQYLSTTDLFISVLDTDTGFDNAYKPVANDQLAFFKGWKVNGYTTGTSVIDETTGQLANAGLYTFVNVGKYRNVVVEKSSDNATWSSAVEGTDYTLDISGTNAKITNISGTALYFRIDYVYGTDANSWISLVDGSIPATNTLAYVSANISSNFTTYTMMYQRSTSVIEEITIEGDLVTNGGATQVTVGSEFTYTTDSDTGKRTYTITPTANRTGANLTQVNVTYDQSLKSAVDSMNTKQSDIATTVSVHANALVDIYARMKTAGI